MRSALLVAGLPGSGKSLFSEAARRAGLPVVSMGDAVRQEAVRRGLGTDAEALARLARELRLARGEAAVAELVLESLPDAPIVVIEGVRSPAEVGLFRRYFGRVALVAIHASPRTRYLRLLKRGRQDDPRTWDEFVQRDKRELSLGIGEVIALADYMLVNEGMSRDEFLERCAEALRRILRDLST